MTQFLSQNKCQTTFEDKTNIAADTWKGDLSRSRSLAVVTGNCFTKHNCWSIINYKMNSQSDDINGFFKWRKSIIDESIGNRNRNENLKVKKPSENKNIIIGIFSYFKMSW